MSFDRDSKRVSLRDKIRDEKNHRRTYFIKVEEPRSLTLALQISKLF